MSESPALAKALFRSLSNTIFETKCPGCGHAAGQSFGALPQKAWQALGILELAGTAGLIVPAALHWQPALTVVAAAFLKIESQVFVWMHAKYREITPIILIGVLGLLMAFIGYGRMVPQPNF